MRTFVVVEWPESQKLMDYEDFDENAFLVNDDNGISTYGSSAYFVDKNWLDNQIF